MKNLLFILAILLIVSCGQKSNNNSESVQEESATESSDNKVSASVDATFDINAIPISNAETGTFPYLTAPEGYNYSTDGKTRKYEEKYFFYNDSLVMTIGGKYYYAKVEPNEGEEFSETYVVKDYEKAIEKLGGVRIYSGGSVDKLSDLLRENKMPYAEDMYNPYPYTYEQFVIRKPSGNIWIEICHGLNIPAVDFTVIYEGVMEETVRSER